MGKFSEHVTNLNDTLMIAGLLMIFEPFVYFGLNFIPTATGLIVPSNLGFFILYITLAAAVTIASLVPFFIVIFWSFNKHRPLLEVGAVILLLTSTMVLYTFNMFMIGNSVAQQLYSFVIALLPYLFLILDAIKKKQPRLFVVFFIIFIVTRFINLIPLSSNVLVESQGMINTLSLLGELRSLASLPLLGLYFLVVTERGKTWFDKTHAAVLFLGYGACDTVLIAIENAMYATIYGGIFRIQYGILPLISDGFAIFVGLRAWMLCNKDLPDNVLYHVL